ncbi:RidA family protein [Actinokineospora soli]|uniref:RidA family protein n=1 Tax=Actinokineospora soli TaxID=1048753 RepID=A0ABW2TS40_9PSEU
MEIARVDPPGSDDPGITNGVVVTGAQRWLYITAQPPFLDDHTVPEGFEAQYRAVWANLVKVLKEAGMGVENLVKVNTYLARRSDREANSLLRQEMLGAHKVAMCIIIADMWDESWLLEIDAVAAA